MLNWLKRRAKISFQNRYTNILRRSNSPDMFLTEQSMLNQQQSQAESIKLLVFNVDGEEYSLDVPLEMTLDRVKLMAIGHFFNPFEAAGSSCNPRPEGDSSKSSNPSTRYRLILARDYRTLLEEKSVTAEELQDNDEILLLECRKVNSNLLYEVSNPLTNSNEENAAPTIDQIKKATINIPPRNSDRQAQPVNNTLDFKVALRQILITMIEASIHLIAPEDNAVDQFVLVFEHLEKRHKPRVDKASLRQLTEMGFCEARAIKALQFKRNVEEATEWLLDETNKQQQEESLGDGNSDLLFLNPERRRSFFLCGDDPAKKVMREFKKYVEKWFVPDSRALQSLMRHGYGEDLAKEALRVSCNNEKLAKDFLEGNSNVGENLQKGFERDSPIMSAILDSPIVQVALSKPKTLFALMVLCETPNNVNVWLSDPETHPVVSQVLRIYHAEKHRLFSNPESRSMETEGDPPPNSPATTSTSSSTSPAYSSASNGETHRREGASNLASPISPCGSRTTSAREDAPGPSREAKEEEMEVVEDEGFPM